PQKPLLPPVAIRTASSAPPPGPPTTRPADFRSPAPRGSEARPGAATTRYRPTSRRGGEALMGRGRRFLGTGGVGTALGVWVTHRRRTPLGIAAGPSSQ